MTTRMVALLRGINVGKAKRVAMADLRAALDAAGFAEVRTHLQTGNVVLDCPDDRVSALVVDIGRVVHELGVDCAVLTRTADELAAAIDGDPLADVATDDSRHLLAFLDGDPDPAAVTELIGGDFGADRIAVLGRHAYLWCAAGILDSPLKPLTLDTRLGVGVTTRNWRTVTRLAVLAGPS